MMTNKINSSQDPEKTFFRQIAEIALRVRTHNDNCYKAADEIYKLSEQVITDQHEKAIRSYFNNLGISKPTLLGIMKSIQEFGNE